jgi:hypothetical protein
MSAPGDRQKSTEEPMAVLHRSRVIGVFVALVVIALIGAYLRRELMIDACLDRGGRWDYAANQCSE